MASPDGRRVAFLDLQHGPKDRHGTPPSITGFQGDALLVHGATGDYRVPLDGGAPTRTAGGD